MKYYRLVLMYTTLLAFAGQVYFGHGVARHTISNYQNKTLISCPNLTHLSDLDFTSCSAIELSCNTSFSLYFLAIHFSWKPVEFNYAREIIIAYNKLQEQLYVQELLEPPQKLLLWA